jgi:MoaA/NifB/PqqE/SkfB family radical SAM enzyme
VHAILNYHSVCRWLREFDQHGVLGVGFGGGEPTLHPRFADFCKFTTRETSLAVTFTTHGHHLQPKLLGQLEGQVNFIRMSMDGVGRTYERFRRKSFVAFTERVREVRSIAPVGINFVVNADTVEDLDEAIAFAHAEGVREFLLLPELPVGPRRGVGISEISQLQAWVRAYRGTVRLAVSEAGAEGMGTCDPCSEEIGLRSFAHITAAGRLQRSSFVDTGVPIAAGGVMAALKTLKHHPLPT